MVWVGYISFDIMYAVADIKEGPMSRTVIDLDDDLVADVARAWEVQGELTSCGQHRGAGPLDLVVAATAEQHGLTLLHHDHDFDVIARVTGQPLRWYAPY